MQQHQQANQAKHQRSLRPIQIGQAFTPEAIPQGAITRHQSFGIKNASILSNGYLSDNPRSHRSVHGLFHQKEAIQKAKSAPSQRRSRHPDECRRLFMEPNAFGGNAVLLDVWLRLQ